MTKNYSLVELGMAYEYVTDAPYLDNASIELLVFDHGHQIIMGLAGLMYTAEAVETLRIPEIKRLLNASVDIGEGGAQNLMYYARAFPLEATFVPVYFDDLTLAFEPTEENPHLIHRHCPYRKLPIEQAEQIADKMILAGIHHAYLIPALCAKGICKNENQ